MNNLNEFVRVIIKDHLDRVLMVSHREKSKYLWNFPGGKVEPGEDPETAAKREVLEETGVELSGLTYVYEDYFKIGELIWKGYFYTAKSCSSPPKNMEPTKLGDVNFYDWDKIKDSGIKAFVSDIYYLIPDINNQEEQCQLRLNLWSSSEKPSTHSA